MDEKELKETHEIINDVWQFIKCFAHITDTDAYWDSMIATSDEIWFKHNKNELCKNLLYVCMKYFNDKAQGKKGHEPTATQITGPPARSRGPLREAAGRASSAPDGRTA